MHWIFVYRYFVHGGFCKKIIIIQISLRKFSAKAKEEQNPVTTVALDRVFVRVWLGGSELFFCSLPPVVWRRHVRQCMCACMCQKNVYEKEKMCMRTAVRCWQLSKKRLCLGWIAESHEIKWTSWQYYLQKRQEKDNCVSRWQGKALLRWSTRLARLQERDALCIRKVQSKSKNPQRSSAVWKFYAYDRSEVPKIRKFSAYEIFWIYGTCCTLLPTSTLYSRHFLIFFFGGGGGGLIWRVTF